MKNDSHHCRALVLHCIDYRFRKIFHDYFSGIYPDGFDLVSVAGGVKDLFEGDSESNYLINQLKLSCNLHKPEVIALVQHEDCGAYGGSDNFENKEIEERFQHEELNKAEALLKDQLPTTHISKYYARLSGEIIKFPSVSYDLVRNIKI